MKLHELKNEFDRKPRKRVGRGDGSGHGKTSGRGEKGAGARSGSSYRPYFEGGQIPFFRRLPKRGFKNPNHCEYNVVNVSYFEEHFDAGTVIDIDLLCEQGIVRMKDVGLKVLGDGELSKAFTVRASKFSAGAKAKIEGAGGVCEVA